MKNEPSPGERPDRSTSQIDSVFSKQAEFLKQAFQTLPLKRVKTLSKSEIFQF